MENGQAGLQEIHAGIQTLQTTVLTVTSQTEEKLRGSTHIQDKMHAGNHKSQLSRYFLMRTELR